MSSSNLPVVNSVPDPDRSPTELSPIDAAIFDAARACVAEFGVRRTTLTEVARRAGVSRPTVYRRWPDTGSLVAELLVRELREILDATTPVAGDGPARQGGAGGTGAGSLPAKNRFGQILPPPTPPMGTKGIGRGG
ncbi:TetR/AcrR family transcriptional regulator, partial [Nocardia farcinica]|uniref:TetR/AcrR family transcriptional regulator n=1 Tax=Nocardia farcinica TaxID=37329 RepID=UPI00245503B1